MKSALVVCGFILITSGSSQMNARVTIAASGEARVLRAMYLTRK